MEEYAIITDSGSDISPEELGKWGVERVDLTFRFEGEDRVYADREMAAAEFYDCLRKGKQARTSGANVGDFTSVFEASGGAGRPLPQLFLGTQRDRRLCPRGGGGIEGKVPEKAHHNTGYPLRVGRARASGAPRRKEEKRRTAPCGKRGVSLRHRPERLPLVHGG